MESHRRPPVSVIIISYNMRDFIGKCLDSLMRQTFPKDKFEILVVDNGSTDGTRELVEEYPVRVVVEKKKGYGRARNKGVMEAKGEIVVFIDADCVAPKHWLQTMLQNYRSTDSPVAVGGPIINPYPKNKVARTIYYSYAGDVSMQAAGKKSFFLIEKLNKLPGCNSSFKKDALLKIGSFPEEISCAEDISVTLKFLSAKKKIRFDSNAKVVHFFTRNLRKLGKTEERSGMGHYDLGRLVPNFPFKGPGNPLVALVFLPLMFIGRVGRGLIRIAIYSETKKDIFSLSPYLIYSAVYWVKGYMKRAFDAVN